MAGIIAHIPNDKPRFLPASAELLACCATEAVTFVRGLLCSSLGCQDEDGFRILFRERDLDETSAANLLKTLATGQLCVVRVLFRLLGGKGGFGALLRKQANRGKKTTNLDAMRDLSGQRLRHSMAVERIKNWMEKKQAEDELVNLIAGEGPELPAKTPESDSLDPEFVRKLKRSSADRPSVVAAGMRALEEGQEPAKRPRTVQSTASSSAAASKTSADWPGMFSALGTLSSPEGESSEEGEPGMSSSAAAAADDGLAVAAVDVASGTSSSSGHGAKGPTASLRPAEGTSASATSSLNVVVEEVTTVKVTVNPDISSASAASKQEMDMTRPAASVEPAGDTALLEPEDARNFTTVAELLGKVSAEVLKKSLQRLGLKCGGKPEERAARFLLLKDKTLEELPKSVLAPK